MNCKACGKGMPDHPVCTVEVYETLGFNLEVVKRDATICDLHGRLMLELLDCRSKAQLEQWAHDYAESEGVNLHFHYHVAGGAK